MLCGRSELRTSPHCIWGIFISRYQLVQVGRYPDSSDCQEHGGCDEKSGSLFLLPDAYADKHHGSIYENDDCQIIGDLRMVCLYLHAEGEGKQD